MKYKAFNYVCKQNKMVGHKTFTIIKPDAFKASYAGPIIEIIENAGF